MINPENQRKMSARMNARKIITLAASHASLASRAAEVSALIDEAAPPVAIANLAPDSDGYLVKR
jgi:hypothetical protein